MGNYVDHMVLGILLNQPAYLYEYRGFGRYTVNIYKQNENQED